MADRALWVVVIHWDEAFHRGFLLACAEPRLENSRFPEMASFIKSLKKCKGEV